MPSTATDRLQGLSTSVAIKPPCVTVSTAALTLSGEQTVNGVAVVSGDRVLYAPTTASVDSGIWIVSTGAWSRAKDFDGSRDVVKGTMILVAPGTNAAQFWLVTSDAPNRIGTDAILIEPASADLATLVVDLANAVNATKGSGMVGHGADQSYEAGTVGAKLAEYVSVTDAPFNADKTGTTDSTAAFNSARATGKRVFVPKGTYRVSDIAVVSDMWVEGEADGRTGATVLEVCANNTAAFRHSAAEIVQNVTIKNLRIKAADGITGAKGYRQDDKSVYLASARFEGVETCGDLEIGYDGFFIITRWEHCIDGYRYDPPTGQQHQAIVSIPAAFGQANQTNLCQLVDTHIHRATSGASAAVDIAYGSGWSFESGTHFEDMDTLAIRSRGILQGSISDCWFENIRASNVAQLTVSPAPNAQGSRVWDLTRSRLELYGLTGTAAFNMGSASLLSVDTVAATNIPASVTLINDPLALLEMNAVSPISGAGASGFLTGLRAQRSRIEFSDDVINSPQTANHNILPIGPGGLGASNFTLSGITGAADVASGIGLAGSAVEFTLSGGTNIATILMPARLVTFLRGKTVTLVLMGYAGTANVSDGVFARIWDTVLPDGTNGVTDVSLSVSSGELQVSYVAKVIASDATALRVGFQVGGENAGKTFIVETMALYLGQIKPEGMSIR